MRGGKPRDTRERILTTQDPPTLAHTRAQYHALTGGGGCSPLPFSPCDIIAAWFCGPPFVTADARPLISPTGRLVSRPGSATAGDSVAFVGGAASAGGAEGESEAAAAAVVGCPAVPVGPVLAPAADSAACRTSGGTAALVPFSVVGSGCIGTGGKPDGVGVTFSGTKDDARCFLLRRSASLSSAAVPAA